MLGLRVGLYTFDQKINRKSFKENNEYKRNNVISDFGELHFRLVLFLDPSEELQPRSRSRPADAHHALPQRLQPNLHHRLLRPRRSREHRRLGLLVP